MVSVKRFGKKGFCYASCESPKQFELFVEKNGSKCWINELVPSASHQALLGAVGANTQYPKFALDLEREVPGGPDPENWEEEVEDVLSAVTHVLQGIMGNKDLKPEFWTLDSSRPLARGAYKHSYHLISKNIVLDTLTTGGSICEAVDDELTRRGREDNCIDKSIYSSNRSFRVLGSNKEARGSRLQCRGDVSFEETLLTCYPPSDNLILVRIGNIVTSGKGRKRSASTSYDSSKKLRLDCPIAVQVQEFLDSSPVSLGWLWNGARVREVFQGSEKSGYVYVKVGFDDKGTRHMCAAGEWHRGNCSQTWCIRVNTLCGGSMESRCWPTQNYSRKCASSVGPPPWFPILHPNKLPVRLFE